MFIDQKSTNSSLPENALDGASDYSDFGRQEAAYVTALCARGLLFLTILSLCVVYCYDYVSAVMHQRGALIPGVTGTIGLIVAIIAMVEMHLADSKDGKRQPHQGEEASIAYIFFVICGFAASFALLQHDSQSQVELVRLMSVHVAALFAVSAVILGTLILWRGLITCKDLVGLVEHGV